jgi:hypothetical protein
MHCSYSHAKHTNMSNCSNQVKNKQIYIPNLNRDSVVVFQMRHHCPPCSSDSSLHSRQL